MCVGVTWCLGSDQVLRGEEFPADLVFLTAQHDDPELCGMCHVQTAQLDGETVGPLLPQGHLRAMHIPS